MAYQRYHHSWDDGAGVDYAWRAAQWTEERFWQQGIHHPQVTDPLPPRDQPSPTTLPTDTAWHTYTTSSDGNMLAQTDGQTINHTPGWTDEAEWQ